MAFLKFLVGAHKVGIVIGVIIGILWCLAGLVHFHVHPLFEGSIWTR